MTNVPHTLSQMSSAPLQQEKFDNWLEQKDVPIFLVENLWQDEFVVYASLRHAFIHALFVPASLVNPPDINDLMAWNCNAGSSWGISYSFSSPASVSISPPLDHTGSRALDQGEQLVFARYFEGRLGNQNYYEVLQKFVHLFGLHFLPERNAYCRLNVYGDIEEAIRIIEIPENGDDSTGTVITVERSLLDEYMVLSDAALIRTFDFTRFRPSHFRGWSNNPNTKHTTERDLFYRLVIEPGHASYSRGCQIVRSSLSKEMIIQRFHSGEKERQYASFIAHDWKNGFVREISCAPGATANYFTKSDLPYETSPAFFRPEVLSKYKVDSEKYRLGDRTISCRGAWHLQTYDINDAGQVHAYLVYLRHLPYEEQLHWKAYNEEPKGPISKRAFTTDFKGEWDLEYDPLNSLKSVVRDLHAQRVPWWTLRSAKLIDQVHYPVTPSADEWANEILQLDQLVVEGFEERWLRQKVATLGRTPDPKLRSLGLVEEYLMALGFEEEHARQIVAPLREIHALRSKLRGHASGKEAITIKKEILTEHGSYKKHFQALSGACDESMQTIVKAFEN